MCGVFGFVGREGGRLDLRALGRTVVLPHAERLRQDVDVPVKSTRASLEKRPAEVAAMFDGVARRYDLIVIDVGPKHPGYRDAVQNTLDVMDAVGDKAIIPSVLGRKLRLSPLCGFIHTSR